jgi:hypothetical protein
VTTWSLIISGGPSYLFIRSQGQKAFAAHTAAFGLPGKDQDMLKVVFPTVAGFVAMMSVWGVTAATYVM